ncbi:threonine dehydratase [Salmonella enterica subsp. arizonae]|nr:threonine dehydratase [Salmonella enterica subsp. arizonae]
MAESQPLSVAPEGAEYLRAVLRAPVYEAAQVTPLQKNGKALVTSGQRYSRQTRRPAAGT